jgi:mycofactocin precursor
MTAIRERRDKMECGKEKDLESVLSQDEACQGLTDILEEIEVEDLTVDGICGVY